MTEPKKEKSYSDNEKTAQVGRNLTIVSSLLFFHSTKLVDITKLPFVNATVNTTNVTTSYLLLIISFYYCYKFYTYNKSHQHFSRVDELSKYYLELFITQECKRIANKAKCKILANFDDYSGVRLTPITYMSGYEERYYNRYNLISVEFANELKLPKESDFDRLSYMDSSSFDINVMFDVSFTYGELNKATLEYDYISIGSTTLIKPYRCDQFLKIARFAKFVSYISLPDFIEKNFPYVVFAVSALTMISGFSFDMPADYLKGS